MNTTKQLRNFSTKYSVLRIDPITAIVLEAEKYAPKNVKQIEERIYEIEEQLSYNKQNLSEQALCDIYDELSEQYTKIFRYEKAEAALMQHIEFATKIFGEVSFKLGDAYHRLAMINVAVDKLQGGVPTTK